jgi:hypothetical protein
LFVTDSENFFHGVGKRAVTHIMQERRGARRRAVCRLDRIPVAQLIEDAGHQVERSKTVSETRVLGTLVGVQTKPELFDATQSLKLWRVDQANHQPAFGAVVAQRDDVVNRIAINSLRQALETYSMAILWIGSRSLPQGAARAMQKKVGG